MSLATMIRRASADEIRRQPEYQFVVSGVTFPDHVANKNASDYAAAFGQTSSSNTDIGSRTVSNYGSSSDVRKCISASYSVKTRDGGGPTNLPKILANKEEKAIKSKTITADTSHRENGSKSVHVETKKDRTPVASFQKKKLSKSSSLGCEIGNVREGRKKSTSFSEFYDKTASLHDCEDPIKQNEHTVHKNHINQNDHFQTNIIDPNGHVHKGLTYQKGQVHTYDSVHKTLPPILKGQSSHQKPLQSSSKENENEASILVNDAQEIDSQRALDGILLPAGQLKKCCDKKEIRFVEGETPKEHRIVHPDVDTSQKKLEPESLRDIIRQLSTVSLDPSLIFGNKIRKPTSGKAQRNSFSENTASNEVHQTQQRGTSTGLLHQILHAATNEQITMSQEGASTQNCTTESATPPDTTEQDADSTKILNPSDATQDSERPIDILNQCESKNATGHTEKQQQLELINEIMLETDGHGTGHRDFGAIHNVAFNNGMLSSNTSSKSSVIHGPSGVYYALDEYGYPICRTKEESKHSQVQNQLQDGAHRPNLQHSTSRCGYDAKLEKSSVYLHSRSRTFTRASQYMKDRKRGLSQLNVHYSQTNTAHNDRIIFTDLLKSAHVKNSIIGESVYTMERRLYSRRKDPVRATTFFDQFLSPPNPSPESSNTKVQRKTASAPIHGTNRGNKSSTSLGKEEEMLRTLQELKDKSKKGYSRRTARTVADKKRQRQERINKKKEQLEMGYTPRATTLTSVGEDDIARMLDNCRYLRVAPWKQPNLYGPWVESQSAQNEEEETSKIVADV